MTVDETINNRNSIQSKKGQIKVEYLILRYQRLLEINETYFLRILYS